MAVWSVYACVHGACSVLYVRVFLLRSQDANVLSSAEDATIDTLTMMLRSRLRWFAGPQIRKCVCKFKYVLKYMYTWYLTKTGPLKSGHLHIQDTLTCIVVQMLHLHVN